MLKVCEQELHAMKLKSEVEQMFDFIDNLELSWLKFKSDPILNVPKPEDFPEILYLPVGDVHTAAQRFKSEELNHSKKLIKDGREALKSFVHEASKTYLDLVVIAY